MTVHWGLLAPENVKTSRRRLTLDLGRATMLYNEAAVPGIGGVWFIRQVALALLGIQVAQEYPSAGSKIQVANAIEALACWIGYSERRWSRGDWRLRGPRKLQGLVNRGSAKTFEILKSRNAYVTQPMRMGCVEALPGLGLADAGGAQFNSFSVNALGAELVAAVFDGHKSLPRLLDQWVRGQNVHFTHSLSKQINPTSDAGDAARRVMREALAFSEGAPRRLSAMSWMRHIDKGAGFGTNPHVDWNIRPPELAEDHWKDLRAGAALTQVRNAAIGLIAAIEQHLVDHSKLDLSLPLPEQISGALIKWQEKAQLFINLDSHGPDIAAADALKFCREALLHDPKNAITCLVKRESHMLRVTRGQFVEPTPAWRKSAALGVQDETAVEPGEAEGSAAQLGERDVLPADISIRMIHLRRLTLDMDGRLDAFIAAQGQSR